MKFPRRVTNGMEQDVHTRWRKVLASTERPGLTKYVKRMTNKRERREGRDYTRRETP